MKVNLENKKNDKEKIEVAHMTSGGRGLYIGDKETEKIFEKKVSGSEIKDIEEELQSGVKSARTPKTFSLDKIGGEKYGNPKFKEKLKLKNFRAKITEILKTERRNDQKTAENIALENQRPIIGKYEQEAEEFDDLVQKEAKEKRRSYREFFKKFKKRI